MKLARWDGAPAGPRGAPALVYLHGFPDHPPTARAFLAHLATRRTIIAPFLRGDAPSPRVGPYDLESLADDVLELIDDGEPVDLVGHDWGAVIAYVVAARAPERLRQVVTLAVPHPFTLLRRLRALAQLRRSWYMLGVQLPGSRRLVDRLWRAWSPGFALPDDDRRALAATLDSSWPAPTRYYTDFIRRPPRRTPPIRVPVLQLHGANDGCILPPGDRDARRFEDRTYDVVPNVGHFLHLEDPAGIAARVLAFLR